MGWMALVGQQGVISWNHIKLHETVGRHNDTVGNRKPDFYVANANRKQRYLLRLKSHYIPTGVYKCILHSIRGEQILNWSCGATWFCSNECIANNTVYL